MSVKKIKKKRSKGFCVFVFGAKKMKGLNRRSISLALTKMAGGGSETEDLSYVVMGNVRETEKIAYSICRKCHLPVAIVPADFEKFSGSAEYLRNGLAWKFFKPSGVVLIYKDEKEVLEESQALSILRWAK